MPSADEEERLKLVGDFKHGSIKCVKLTNFLTYSYVEFNAGPRLNMVVGPNGTGKSTILCAICLGLGGEPRLLGRASEIETFVMNGEEEGEIEIELVDTEGRKNPIIRRVIRRGRANKNLFFLNGESTTGKKIRDLCLQRYYITVDNLCTFLPQDRVGSFSGFDSKQLLQETEKSLSSTQHLYQIHQELIRDQIDMNGGESQVEVLTARIEQLTGETRRFEREKVRMEERERALEDAKLYEKKALWLRFDSQRTACFELKDKRNEKKNELRELTDKLQPLIVKHEQLEQKIHDQTQTKAALERECLMHKKEMAKQKKKYENHDDAMQNILVDISSMRAQRENQIRKVADLEEKHQQVQEQISGYSSFEAYQEEIHLAQQEQRAIRPQYTEAKKQVMSFLNRREEIQGERDRAASKLKKLQDTKTQQRNLVFRQKPNLKKIYDFLNQGNNRNKFRKEVIGPIACEIATKTRNAAAYLEQHTSNATLQSFVVQCKEDYDLLYKTVRERMNIPINIILVDKVESKPRPYSEQKLNVLKQEHGVIGYMDESFTAPPIVVHALKLRHAIHQVLVGNDKTQESIDSRNLSDFLSQSENGQGLQKYSIFTSQGDRSFQYTSTISNYSRKSVLRVDDVRPAKWLSPGVSEEAKQREMEKVSECNLQLKEIEPQLAEAKEQESNLLQQQKILVARIKENKEGEAFVRKLVTRRNNIARKLEAEREKIDEDNEGEKEKKVNDLKKRLHHALIALSAHSDTQTKLMTATTKLAGFSLNGETVTIEERRARQERDEMQNKTDRAGLEFEQMSKAFKEKKAELAQIKADAMEQAPLEDEDGNDLPLKEQLEALPVSDIHECEAAYEEAKQKAESIIADPNVVRQYKKKKEELEEAQAELDNLESSKEKRQNEMDQKFRPWKQALENSVAQIDKRFSKYMAELGCTGEVALAKGELADNEDKYGNFKDWGIEIRVSFRDGVKPSVLSARVQSGGERSVSTIMYLMALQEMMVCPFRCVDEINQGLDERNERLVFKRIVANSCQAPGKKGPTDHCGQYFLITPKLLPNLVDMEVEAITIQCIFNGPYALKNPSEWNVSKLLALREKRVIESEAAYDEENVSENSQSQSGKKRRRTGDRGLAELSVSSPIDL